MASKGGGETLSDIGSFLGNAFIPQTMDRFRQMQEAPQRRSAISSLIDSSGIAAADPTASPDSVARPGIADQVFRNIAPNTDAGKFNTVESFRKATPAFDPAFLTSQIGKMFPAPGKPVEVSKGGKLVNDVTGKVIADNPETPKTPEDPEFLRILTAYQGMKDDNPNKAFVKNWLEKNSRDSTETWTPMSPDQVAAAGLPSGNYKRSSTGNIQSITTPQQERIPQGFRMASNGKDLEFIPGGPADPNMQSPAQKAQLGKIEADSGVLSKTLDNYKTAVKDASWDDFKSAAVGGLTKGGQRLKGAWTNAALMAKGQGLYELGVLSGPDMEVITGALKDPGSVMGQFASKDAYLEGIDQITKLINTRVAEYRQNLGSPSQRAAPPPANSTAGWSIVRVK